MYKAKVLHSKYSCVAEYIYELLIVLFCNLNIINLIRFVLHTESSNLPRRPPLEVALAHAQELVRLMSRSGLGSCAFASVDDLLQHWLVRSEADKRTVNQHIRFHLNLMTSTKDLVIYCLRKACSAWMRESQHIALVTGEHKDEGKLLECLYRKLPYTGCLSPFSEVLVYPSFW